MSRNLKNLSTVLQYLHYKCKIKFFSRIVTISFSEKSNVRQNNRMNCGQKKQIVM